MPVFQTCPWSVFFRTPTGHSHLFYEFYRPVVHLRLVLTPFVGEVWTPLPASLCPAHDLVYATGTWRHTTDNLRLSVHPFVRPSKDVSVYGWLGHWVVTKRHKRVLYFRSLCCSAVECQCQWFVTFVGSIVVPLPARLTPGTCAMARLTPGT